MQAYDAQQLNQINKGLEENNEYIKLLSPELNVEMFRSFRNICNKYNPPESVIFLIVYEANENQDIRKLEYIYEKTKNQSFNFSLATQAIKIFDYMEIDKLYNECIDDEKREFIITNYNNKNLIDYYAYDIDCLKVILNNDLDDLKQNIIYNYYTEEQLLYIIQLKEENKLHKEILNSNYSLNKMSLINNLVENSYSPLIAENIDESNMKSYIILIKQGYDITKIKPEYDKNTLDFIISCVNKNYDVDKYLSFLDTLEPASKECWIELCKGNFTLKSLESFVKNNKKLIKNDTIIYIANTIRDLSPYSRCEERDISNYFTDGYSKEQLKILKNGYSHNIDLGNYINPNFSLSQMNCILDLLKNDYDVSTVCNIDYTADDMKKICFYNNKGIFFDKKEDYHINYTRDKNQDYKVFVDLAQQLKAQFYDNSSFILLQGLTNYNKKNKYQINIESVMEAEAYYHLDEIYKDLKNNLDINKFWKKEFRSDQRSEIRKGIESGVDIEKYLDPSLNSAQMKEIRLKLESELTLSEKIEQYSNINKKENNIENIER